MGGGARHQDRDYRTMSLRSEMILDAKLVMQDGLARINAAAEIDARGYVTDWHSNLLPGIDPGLIEGDFRAGKGSELDNKFQAAHSSAALAVNVFGPFRDRRDTFPVPGLGDLKLEKFERTFTTGLVGRIPPHLKVAAIGRTALLRLNQSASSILHRRRRALRRLIRRSTSAATRPGMPRWSAYERARRFMRRSTRRSSSSMPLGRSTRPGQVRRYCTFSGSLRTPTDISCFASTDRKLRASRRTLSAAGLISVR